MSTTETETSEFNPDGSPASAAGDIYQWAVKAVAEAKRDNRFFPWSFNDISLVAYPTSNPSDLCEIYRLKRLVNYMRSTGDLS